MSDDSILKDFITKIYSVSMLQLELLAVVENCKIRRSTGEYPAEAEPFINWLESQARSLDLYIKGLESVPVYGEKPKRYIDPNAN